MPAALPPTAPSRLEPGRGRAKRAGGASALPARCLGHSHSHSRGLSLLDLTVALAVVGIFASMALPPMQQHLARARRAEAIVALEQLQLTQETYRGHHGRYAPTLAGLQGVQPTGPHYELSLAAAHANGYIARAVARDTALREGGCTELTLTVADGSAAYGPSERCWNR